MCNSKKLVMNLKTVIKVLFSTAFIISLVANYVLLEWAIEGSYAREAEPRYIKDIKVLSSLIDKGITSDELVRTIKEKYPDIKVNTLFNQSRHFDFSKKVYKYPIAIETGGGDTIAAIQKFGIENGVSYITTGGGSFLEYMEGKTLPAIAILEERFGKS